MATSRSLSRRITSTCHRLVDSVRHLGSQRSRRRRLDDSSLPVTRCRPVTNPVLAVADMRASVGFYEGLGFTVEQYDDGYAWVKHCGDEYFHLVAVGQPPTAGGGAYVHVDDPDAWHVALSALDSDECVGQVVDQPWSMREFAVVDPDGNRIRFGTNL